MASLTRRDLVQRGALYAGVAGAASLGGLGGVDRALAAAAAGPRLTPQRQATYAALVEAVALGGNSKVSARNLEGTAAGLADSYANAPGETRSGIDRLLDALEAGPRGGSFTQMGKRARLAHLRAWLDADPHDRPRGGPTRPGLAQAAVDLAALPFYPNRTAHDSAPVAL